MNPKGVYYGKIASGVTTNSNSRSPQVELELNITHIGNPATGEWDPITLSHNPKMYLSCHDNAWQYTEKKLAALGFDGNFSDPAFACDGTTFLCEHREVNGKLRESWELERWGSGPEKAAQDVTARLSARWKAGNKPSAPAGRPAAPPAATKTAPPPPPAATKVNVTNKDEAWDAFCRACDGEPDLTCWNDGVTAVAEKVARGEEDFTADDWKLVAEQVVVPF